MHRSLSLFVFLLTGLKYNARANATLILHPPDNAEVGNSNICLVNCNPDKMAEALASAEPASNACNRSLWMGDWRKWRKTIKNKKERKTNHKKKEKESSV